MTMATFKEEVDLYENSNAIVDSSLDAFIYAVLGDVIQEMKSMNVNESKGVKGKGKTKSSDEKILQIIIMDQSDDNRSSESGTDQSWNETAVSEYDMQSATLQNNSVPSEIVEKNNVESNGSNPMPTIKSRSKSGSSLLNIFRSIFKRNKRNSSTMTQISTGFTVNNRKPRKLKFWRKSKSEVKADGILNKAQMETMEQPRIVTTNEEVTMKGKSQTLQDTNGALMKTPLSSQNCE